MKPKVVLTHWVHPQVLALLGQSCEVIANMTRETLPRAKVLELAHDADAIMTFMPDSVDESFLRTCPRLKVIGCALKGYDNYDVDACTRRGVWLTIVPDLLTVPTAELTIGLLIALTRKILAGDRVVRSGAFNGWRPTLYGTGLAGRTVGIIGMGAVGRAIAQRLQGFEATLVYADPKPVPSNLEKKWGLAHLSLEPLLQRSDFVLPMLPLRAETMHLIDAHALALMKPGSFLINACRGSVVDEAAVAEALAAGRLAGYAADVFELEDWARVDRPRSIPPRLLDDTARTLFTPHLGSAVADVRLAIEMEAAANILQALHAERPSGAVNEPLARAIA